MKQHHLLWFLTMLSIVMEVHGFEYEGFNFNVISEVDKTVEVTTSSVSSGQTIPSIATDDATGKEYTVIRIGDGAFKNCENLYVVDIPTTIRSIGDEAFSGCKQLGTYNAGTIVLPSSITSIGANAFKNCYALTSITIPSSVLSVGDGAFYGCRALASFTFSATTSLGRYLFERCNALTSIVLPNGMTSIGDETFAGSFLTSVTIPAGVISIGEGAFANCPFTSITLPESLQSIGNSAFNSTALTSISIPDNVNNIGANAFYYCSALTSISLPNNITRLAEGLFGGCTNLTSVEIPESVEMIEAAVFYESGLTSIFIPRNVEGIETDAFANCASLSLIVFEGDMPSYNKNYEPGRYYIDEQGKEHYFATAFYMVGSEESPVSLIVPAEYASHFEELFNEEGLFLSGYVKLSAGTHSVTLSPDGYATYYNGAVGMRLPNGLSAKTVTAITNGELSYDDVAEDGGIVPAATAVLLCGPATEEPTTYTLNYTQEGSYAGPNLLRGSDAATTTTGGEVYYKLTYGSASGHEDVFGWYWGEEDGAAFSIGAHKAWLAITREQAGLDGGTPVKSFGLPGNVTDGLPNMEGFGQTKQLSEPYYHDLQGRRVSRPASGLYIVNGKKIAIM